MFYLMTSFGNINVLLNIYIFVDKLLKLKYLTITASLAPCDTLFFKTIFTQDQKVKYTNPKIQITTSAFCLVTKMFGFFMTKKENG